MASPPPAPANPPPEPTRPAGMRDASREEQQISAQHFRAAFEQAAVGMSHVSLEGRWLRVNQKMCEIVGYTRDEMLRMSFRDLTHPDDLDLDLPRQALAGKIATYQVEKRYLHKQGHHVWGQATVTLVRTADGRPDYFLAVVVDISARKAAEARLQQTEAEIRRINADLEKTIQARTAELQAAKDEAERANRAKDSLMANVSHEIRTPLNAILGAAQVLERGAQGDQLKALVRSIRSAGRSLTAVINDLLDLAKIQAGRFEVARIPFRLEDVLASLSEVLQSTATEKGLWLRVHPVPPLDTVLGDPQRLGQVLYNLAGNALKFTETGGVDVRVQVLERHPGRVALRLSVRDTGPGVDPSLRPRLFSPFEQAEPATRKQLGGTGLGLAICRQLVTLMGGEIGVDSEPGQGSEFWFTLGLPTSAEPAVAVRPESQPAPGLRRLQGVRLLVVDDAPVNREIARLLLEGEGAQVEVAEDGALALRRLRAGPRDFDLVLMDMQMPVMDGLEATRQVRADPALEPLPVLALTAAAQESQRRQALAAGMDDYIVKPFELDAVVATVLHHLRRTQAPPQSPPPGA